MNRRTLTMTNLLNLTHTTPMRRVVGDRAITGSAALASQMGRFLVGLSLESISRYPPRRNSFQEGLRGRACPGVPRHQPASSYARSGDPKGEYVSLDDFSERASAAEIAAFVCALGHVAREQGVAETGYRILANNGPPLIRKCRIFTRTCSAAVTSAACHRESSQDAGQLGNPARLKVT